MIAILTNAITHKTDDKKLLTAQNRGGLTYVTMECQQIFIRAEETFMVNTPAEKHLEKIETRNMTMKLMKNTEVVSFYNVWRVVA